MAEDPDALIERMISLIDQAMAKLCDGDHHGALVLIKDIFVASLELPRKGRPDPALTKLPKLRLKANADAPCRQQSDESGMRGECMRCGAEQGEACREKP